MDIQQFLAEFAESVLHQKERLRTGRSYGPRRRDVGSVFDDLVNQHGDAGREALATLFNHDDDDVATTAAAFLLRYCTTGALETLRRISMRDDFTGFCAGEAIKRWEEGEWELDLVPKA
jgi:hypothetical protein